MHDNNVRINVEIRLNSQLSDVALQALHCRALTTEAVIVRRQRIFQIQICKLLSGYRLQPSAFALLAEFTLQTD